MLILRVCGSVNYADKNLIYQSINNVDKKRFIEILLMWITKSLWK